MIRERGICCALPVVKESWAEPRAELMKALADPTRLTMIASLWKAESPICICDFTAGLSLSQPTISHQMARLTEAGLVDSELRGIGVLFVARCIVQTATRTLTLYRV